MGERAYAYTKACGIIGKSFLGKRMRSLEKVSRLSELDRMIFPAGARDLPEKELLLNLEERIMGRAVDSILSIVDSFSRPPLFLVLLLRSYEYADLKSAISASLEKDKTAPVHVDLGRFQIVRFNAWPDIEAMVEGTEFAFILNNNNSSKEKKKEIEQGDVSLQTLLDRHYYSALWESLLALPRSDSQAAEKILSDEISLRNSSWVLRLRSYYGMSADEARSYLIDIPGRGKRRSGSGARSLAYEAIQSLDFPLDNFSAWSSWRWKEFLNPEGSSGAIAGRQRIRNTGIGQWHADPRTFQNAASRYLYRLARHHFHLKPFSLDSIFCFIKLKQFEEDVLTSGAEGLSIGMSAKDTLSMLEVDA